VDSDSTLADLERTQSKDLPAESTNQPERQYVTTVIVRNNGEWSKFIQQFKKMLGEKGPFAVSGFVSYLVF